MSNKKRIKDLIKARVAKNRIFKTKSAKRAGPKTIVLEFIEEFEKLREEVGDSLIEFDSGLSRLGGFLESRLQAIDPDVDISIQWNNEHDTENWKDLRVDSVTITWSSFYIGKHMFSDKVFHIDIGSLFLEGVFEDTED